MPNPINVYRIQVGDDVFGEDPTINELETRVSKMFGKENSLFFPSGTMSNLAAVMSWCGTRGSEMILGDSSHIHLFEQVCNIYLKILSKFISLMISALGGYCSVSRSRISGNSQQTRWNHVYRRG